jgi:hypothetical protein
MTSCTSYNPGYPDSDNKNPENPDAEKIRSRTFYIFT